MLLLCKTKGEGEQWLLWHADVTRERSFYQYQEHNKMVSGGAGGMWLLCKIKCGDGFAMVVVAC